MDINNIKKLENKEKKHFDLLAAKYDRNYGYKDRFIQYKIWKKINILKYFLSPEKIDKEFRILELGSGTGEYTKLLSQNYPNAKIIGIDISKEMINIAKRKCAGCKNVTFKVESVYKVKEKDESFDLVCGFYTLHHLKIKSTIKEIRRVLKDGGMVYFCEPNILNPIVYLIKKIKFIKKMVGDSPDEWAINPLTIAQEFKPINIKILYREFIFPIPNRYKVNIFLDKLSTFICYIPIIKYFSGTVVIIGKK